MARHRQPAPQLVFSGADNEEVWRVGYQPHPWAWAGWEWAGPDGRFHGRWDDYRGTFRTVYAGTTLLGASAKYSVTFSSSRNLCSVGSGGPAGSNPREFVIKA